MFLLSAESDGISGQAAERRLGPLARPPGAARRSVGERHLHAAADRSQGPRPGLGRIMKLAIVGCGLIGAEAAARRSGPSTRSSRCADPVLARAAGAGRAGARRGRRSPTGARPWNGPTWTRSSCRPATTPWRRSRAAAVEAGQARARREAGGAQRPTSCGPIIAAAEQRGVCVQVGFNHRLPSRVPASAQVARRRGRSAR